MCLCLVYLTLNIIFSVVTDEPVEEVRDFREQFPILLEERIDCASKTIKKYQSIASCNSEPVGLGNTD